MEAAVNRAVRIAICIVVCALGVARVWADWNPGDPYKMHYPQLPDPFGWDVDFNFLPLADDWMCTADGPVNRIHFWISWSADRVGGITNVHLSIHRNLPPDPDFQYSRPGELLWEDDFSPRYFAVRFWEESQQGWFNPWEPFFVSNDHGITFQVNVFAKPENVFTQELGTIYWLDIKLDATNGFAGWKSSITNFMDDAVYFDPLGPGFKPLTYPPDFERTLDLSFVIDPAPEPVAALSLIGVLALVRRR
jgi:hypothetical protein